MANEYSNEGSSTSHVSEEGSPAAVEFNINTLDSQIQSVQVDKNGNLIRKKLAGRTAKVGRKCRHCGIEKTLQWQAGPDGEKTLCNACGVRFRSGRLVPEYRPAKSPTFCSKLHSNSHRKVLEMRRQKQMIGLPVVKPMDKGYDGSD